MIGDDMIEEEAMIADTTRGLGGAIGAVLEIEEVTAIGQRSLVMQSQEGENHGLKE
jgi:hypothetical protein